MIGVNAAARRPSTKGPVSPTGAQFRTAFDPEYEGILQAFDGLFATYSLRPLATERTIFVKPEGHDGSAVGSHTDNLTAGQLTLDSNPPDGRRARWTVTRQGLPWLAPVRPAS
jgi:hypothetical protein